MGAYLIEVLKRFKVQLAGGSLLVLALPVIEHFTGVSISWHYYLLLMAAIFLTTLIFHGSEQYKALQPVIQIRDLRRRPWEDQRVMPGAEYYFEVFNASKARSIENVNAKLVWMEPDRIGYLPVNLHIKHDNPPSDSKHFLFSEEFSLNPEDGKYIDLLTGPVAGSPHPLIVPHIVRSALKPLPYDHYRLKIRVTGKDTPSVEASFKVWVDKHGELRCAML